MRSKGLVFVYLVLMIASSSLLFISCESQSAKTEMTEQEMIKRGEFLVMVGDCDACHSPKKFGPEGPMLDMSKRLSGHPEGSQLAPVDTSLIGPYVYFSSDLTAAIGPWGITYSANLTPEMTTGIGSWQPEMFINAMRTGKHLGVKEGRPIMPPMPWENLNRLSDEDLKAIFAYLKSLPAIKNKVPDPMPPTAIVAVR